jgi:hypothetical protein
MKRRRPLWLLISQRDRAVAESSRSLVRARLARADLTGNKALARIRVSRERTPQAAHEGVVASEPGRPIYWFSTPET